MKFKNIKKEAKKIPSNSRSFPELFPKLTQARFLKWYGESLKIFIVFIFLLAAVIVGLDLQKNIADKQNVDSQREKLTKELKFWEAFIEKRKDYKDAYFQAAILEHQLGKTVQAKTYLKQGLSLDPNSQDGKKIEEFLNR